MLEQLDSQARGEQLLGVHRMRALSLVELGRVEEAANELRQALALSPEDAHAAEWLALLEGGETANDEDARLELVDSLLAGVALRRQVPILARDLMNESTLEGLDAEKVESGNLTLEDVDHLEELASQCGYSNPLDRAKYLLSAAAVLDRVKRLRDEQRLLADLQSALKARGEHIEAERGSPDVARTYYQLSLKVAPKTKPESWSTLLLYFRSYVRSLKTRKRFKRSDHDPAKLQELLRSLMAHDSPMAETVLDAAVRMAGESRRIGEMLSETITTDKELFDLVKRLLRAARTDDRIQTLERLNERIRTYRHSLSELKAACQQLGESALAESADAWLQEVQTIHPAVLCDLDHTRLDETKRLVQLAKGLASGSEFEDRERKYHLLAAGAEDLLSEIARNPSPVGYELLRPVAAHLRVLADQLFAGFAAAAAPELSLALASEFYVPDDQQRVTIQVTVQNAEQSASANNVRVQVSPHDDGDFFTLCEAVGADLPSLRGGQTHTALLTLRLSDTAISLDAFSVDLDAEYVDRLDATRRAPSVAATVRLYDAGAFETIENRYSAVAESGPVSNRDMFFGRREIMRDTIEALDVKDTTKCLVVYGQKRAGKSSVLHQLELELAGRGFIPVSLSVQSLMTALTESTFLFHILESIDDALQEYCPGWDISRWTPPDEETVRKQPILVFMSSMRSLARRLRDIPEAGRMVLLIDEFTEIYKEILKETLPAEFMKAWKSIMERRWFSAVLAGQDIMPAFKQRFPNEFGVSEDTRLTYLTSGEARQIIEEPVGHERYLPDSVERIIAITAGSPYYTMMLCSRLVDYINTRRVLKVSTADVDQVLEAMISGNDRLSIDKFDNLLLAGDGKYDSGIDADEALIVCRYIAKEAREGACAVSSLEAALPSVGHVVRD